MNDQDGGTPVPTFKKGDIVKRISTNGYEYEVLYIENKKVMRIRNMTTGTTFISDMNRYRLKSKLDKALE